MYTQKPLQMNTNIMQYAIKNGYSVFTISAANYSRSKFTLAVVRAKSFYIHTRAHRIVYPKTE